MRRVVDGVLRSKIIESRISTINDAYDHYHRVKGYDDYCDEDEDGEVDITYAEPAEVYKIKCLTCRFVLYLWAVPCVGGVYGGGPCKVRDDDRVIPESLVIGKCCNCDQNLVCCNRCTYARCDTCRGYLCEECSCGEWSRTVGREVCGKCAGRRYDHLFHDEDC